MKLAGAMCTVGLVFALSLLHSPLQARPVCKVGSLPDLPDVRITSVTWAAVIAPHCKITGIIGTETQFELLLPEKWNGKFAMGGGSGFGGSVSNAALAYGALQSGYATVGTDTGHKGRPRDASWALNNLERIVSFGHQAVHRTAVTAKGLIRAYYGQEIKRNLFVGCSRGGGQALMEAQKYPQDFDGIVAGAPAYDWTNGLGAATTRINQAMYPDPDNPDQAVIGPEQTKLIGHAVLKECDGLDGLEDGILNDPRKCEFDVAMLACKTSNTNTCLTSEEVTAAKAIYDGPRDEKGRIFPGFPVGGELSSTGWAKWLTGGLIGKNSVMKYFVYHDPNWNHADYTFKTFRRDAAAVAPTLNATDPDLSAFRARGGKLLMFQGWNDMAITAYGTIKYYESILAGDATAAKDVRLYMMPGVDHCYGGVGPDWLNYLDEIDNWVETGKAPDQLTAVWRGKGDKPIGSRTICALPKVAKYDGKGSPRNGSSFSCVDDN